jgi:hypothetical protein
MKVAKVSLQGVKRVLIIQNEKGKMKKMQTLFRFEKPSILYWLKCFKTLLIEY